MQDLYSLNPVWFSRILSGLSDRELKDSFCALQKFYDICDSSDASIYYDLLDLMESYFVTEITNRFFKSIK